MSEARRRKLQQFSCDPFSLGRQGLMRRSYSLSDLRVCFSPASSPSNREVSNSFKSTLFLPPSPVRPRINPFRPADASPEMLFGSDLASSRKKENLPLAEFQPKFVTETPWQVKSVELFGISQGRTKEIATNVSASRKGLGVNGQDRGGRRELTDLNVSPSYSVRLPDVCHMFKWSDSRSEVRRKPRDLSAKQRKSAESLSNVFGSPVRYDNFIVAEPEAPVVQPKTVPPIVRAKPKEVPVKPDEPARRNVRVQNPILRNCVPLTPKEMRDVMLRTPQVDYTPSKLLTLELKGLSTSDDEVSIKSACRGFHIVSVHTSHDQIKGTCQGTAKVQLRIHDDPTSIKRLGLRLSEKGWSYQEPGSLGKRNLCSYATLRSERRRHSMTMIDDRAFEDLLSSSFALGKSKNPDRSPKCQVKMQSRGRRGKSLSSIEKDIV